MVEEAYFDTTMVLDSGLGYSRTRMMMIRYRAASVSGRLALLVTDSNQQSLCKQPRMAVEVVVPVNQRSHSTPSIHVL